MNGGTTLSRSTLEHLGSTQSKIPRTDIVRPGSHIWLINDLLTSYCCTRAPDTGCRAFGSECEVDKGCVMTAHTKWLILRGCARRARNSTIAAPQQGVPRPSSGRGKHLPSRPLALSDFGICCSRLMLQKGPSWPFGIPTALSPVLEPVIVQSCQPSLTTVRLLIGEEKRNASKLTKSLENCMWDSLEHSCSCFGRE